MTDKKIEFNKIKEIWSELALTGFAKDEIEKATIILEESKLRKELRDTTNAKEMIEKLLLIVERLKNYLSRGKQYENPLAFYDENLNELIDLKEEIARQIRNDAVDDLATKCL